MTAPVHPLPARVRAWPRRWQEAFVERSGVALDDGRSAQDADAWALVIVEAQMREAGE